jgi:hypothetical protein
VNRLFLVLLISIVLIGCSRLRLNSSNTKSVTFREIEGHTKPVKIKVKKDFYLWGLLPKQHDLDISKVMEEKGLGIISSLEITETEVYDNALYSIISFGMYIPKTYLIQGKTKYFYDIDPKDGDAL